MKRIDPSVIAGLVLILAGGLFILQTMGVLDNVGDLFWGGLFLLGGLLFLIAFFTGAWWGVIPGLTLAAIGGLILLPDALEPYGGALFLGALGLAFWLVYLSGRIERWWALIPAGVLTTLALVTFMPDLVGGEATGSVFFFGLALTFLLVALLARMRWAYYPALALGVVGLLSLLAVGGIANFIWAGILVLAGIYLIARYFRSS